MSEASILRLLLRYLEERHICIIQDTQLRRKVGIFRSLPLITRATGAKTPLLTSVYRTIERYMKLPNFEINYAHFSEVEDIKKDLLLVYAVQTHEKSQYIMTQCLAYETPKILVVRDADSFCLASGKTLTGLLAMVPINYEDLWYSYWKETLPPLIDTRNFAFNTLALDLGLKGRLMQLFTPRIVKREPLWSWCLYLFEKLQSPRSWKAFLRYWIEEERIIEGIVQKLGRIKAFYRV